MSDDSVDLATLGERLVEVRRAYGESIDLPNLETAAFAMMLGVSASAYASYEHGEREPPVDLLVALRNRTHISLDWFLDTSRQEATRRFE
jgi:transcriptional regulator with XRE-family HTH domain